MCKTKIYKDRKKWRVRVIDTATGAIKNHIFDTEESALVGRKRLEREYRRPVGVPIDEALTAYHDKLQARGKRPRTIETAMGRLCSVLKIEAITGEVDTDTAGALWTEYRTRDTRSKRPPSTDSQLGTIKALRAFWAFCTKKGWAKVDPWAGIEVEGSRSRGKRQLTEDQAQAFHATAKRLADAGDQGAVAALLALYLGVRASELVDRVVGDIDANATKLIIPYAKTEAGIRRLLIPEPLRGYVARLVEGRGAAERLFPGRNRHWLLRQVERVCKIANVRRVTSHGLRGTASSLAQGAGMIGDAVAASLGHESYKTTLLHYTDPSAPANAQIARVVAALN